MSTPKFKIGDRVKWKDGEGRAHSGMVHGYEFSSKRYRIADSLATCVWWHESHLSLDVPEPKPPTSLERDLAAQVIAQALTIADQKKEILRVGQRNCDYMNDISCLSTRVTEEIGGRNRERLAKEAAQKELAQTKENERWCCDKLSKLANELSAERVAKTSAQKELAGVRRDLADVRIISKRLTL